MRYQNPLFTLAPNGPSTPKAPGYVDPPSQHEVCLQTAEHCDHCQRLAEDVKRLLQEKQELFADVVSINQAFVRLQQDHAALLQQVACSKRKHQHLHQSVNKDAAAAEDVPDSCTASEQQQHAGDMSALLPPVQAAACELDLPGLPALQMGSSSPMKRKRAKWDKSAPLRSSFKALGDLLHSGRNSMSGRNSLGGPACLLNPTAPQSPKTRTPPHSPKGFAAARTPKGFSRLRASFSRLSFSRGRTTGGGTAAIVTSTLEPPSKGTTAGPIIDVAALTLVNGLSSSSTFGRFPRSRSSSGGGSNATATSGAGNLDSSNGANVPVGAAGRYSVDCVAAAGLIANSRMRSLDGSMRHSTDCTTLPSTAEIAAVAADDLASRLGLSVRTKRKSSIFSHGSSRDESHYSGNSSCSPIHGVTVPEGMPAALEVSVAFADCDSHFKQQGPRIGGFVPYNRSQSVSDHASSCTSLNSSWGGNDPSAGGPAVQLSGRYYSAVSHESGGNCGSHRLSNPGWSDAGTADASAAAVVGSNLHAQGQSQKHCTFDSSSTTSSTASKGHMAGSTASRAVRPSHLRPVSPKSRALKDLASQTGDAPVAADTAADVTQAADSSHRSLALQEAAAAAVPPAASILPAASKSPAANKRPAASRAPAVAAPSSVSVAAAVAELLLPFSAPSDNSKIRFLKSRSSIRTSIGSMSVSGGSPTSRGALLLAKMQQQQQEQQQQQPAESSAAAGADSSVQPRSAVLTAGECVHTAAPGQACEPAAALPVFGRVWDKWSKVKLSSPRSKRAAATAAAFGQQQADSAAAGQGGQQDTAVAAAAAWSLGTAVEAAAAAADAAAAVDGAAAAAVELGLLDPSDAAAAAATAAEPTAACGLDTRAGGKLAAWPLDVGAELEYEAGPGSLRPSIV